MKPQMTQIPQMDNHGAGLIHLRQSATSAVKPKAFP
jgi:hypothetical protein